jgi:cytochrome d ubiquinol oxidase subunit I
VTDLLAARSQMAMSLAFHIVFAVAGIAMPLLMCLAEGRWRKTRDPVDLELAKRWMRGTAILFAVGAVSGTVLSFELGLLWPRFMALAGPIIGMPFSLEGFAFFLEAIFLGIYLYGWQRVPPLAHWLAGWMVALCGALSGVFVVTANAWMNTPAGFRWQDGRAWDVDPIAAVLNPAAFTQCLHMAIAAYVAIGFAVAGIHAHALRREKSNRFHRHALALALRGGGSYAVHQTRSGDLSAKHVAKHQPVKLAAMEGQWETRTHAPLRVGGWPDEENERTIGAIEIPGMLSWLGYGDVNARVQGLSDVPKENRPPVAIVHVAFQVMVGCGTVLALLALVAAALAWKRRGLPDSDGFLRAVTWCSPLGLVALEAGWTVTEVGRQPWVITGFLRTKDAVTPMPGLVVPFLAFTLLYVFLAAVVIVLLRRQVFASPRAAELPREPAS